MKHEDGFDFMTGSQSYSAPMGMNQQESSYAPMNAFGNFSLLIEGGGGFGGPMNQFSTQQKIDGIDGDLSPEEQEQIAKVNDEQD